MTPQQIETLFTGPGGYAFARWGRPIAPVIFGIDSDSLDVVKAAIEAVVLASGHRMTELDPELGANLMVFFLRDWSELAAVDNLDRMLPGLPALVERLSAADASQFRTFRFDEAGTIKAAFVFLRMSGSLAEQPAADLGLEQAVKCMLAWAPDAFAETTPLVRAEGGDAAMLAPDYVNLLAAAYEPAMPGAAADPSHALRLYARMSLKAPPQG